jgi:hypothetical protein
MFALLSGRLRRLLLFMVAIPIGGRLLEAVGRRLESSAGPTRVSRALRSGGQAAGRFSRGPLRPKNAAASAGTVPPGSSLNGDSASHAKGPQGRRGRQGRRSRS